MLTLNLANIQQWYNLEDFHIVRAQIGDRFHACVIGKDLYPPEGSECEKRLIKHLDKTNSLAAR